MITGQNIIETQWLVANEENRKTCGFGESRSNSESNELVFHVLLPVITKQALLSGVSLVPWKLAP